GCTANRFVGLDNEFGSGAAARPEALVRLAIVGVVVEEIDKESRVDLSDVAEPEPRVLRFIVDGQIVYEGQLYRQTPQQPTLGVVLRMKGSHERVHHHWSYEQAPDHPWRKRHAERANRRQHEQHHAVAAEEVSIAHAAAVPRVRLR